MSEVMDLLPLTMVRMSSPVDVWWMLSDRRRPIMFDFKQMHEAIETWSKGGLETGR